MVGVERRDKTYAPPEQSEPAITSSRPWTILAGSEVLKCAPGESENTFTFWISMSREDLLRTSLATVGAGRKVGRGGQDRRNLESERQDHHVIAPSPCVEPCAQ